MDDLSSLDWSKPAASQPRPSPGKATYSSLQPTSGSLAGSGRSTPGSAHGSTGSLPQPTPAKASQDSFGNLLAFGPSKSLQSLTLAERQAQLEAEKRAREEERGKKLEAEFGSGQQWDTLGSHGAANGHGLTLQPAKEVKGNKSGGNGGCVSLGNDDDQDLFAAFNRDTLVDNSSHYPPPTSNATLPPNDKPLDLRNPKAWASTSTSNALSVSVDEDDPFGLNVVTPSANHAAKPVANEASDFDVLGDLGRPVDEVRTMQILDSKPTERRSQESQLSLLDGAVAQLVDYGFSVQDARRGLEATGPEISVESAANWLLDDAHRKSKQSQRTRQNASLSKQPPDQFDRPGDGAKNELDLARSAAAVGSSLFKTANSLWKTGQKKVQQAVSEFQQDADPNQPKWMRNAQRERPTEPITAGAVATDEALALEARTRPTQVPDRGWKTAEARPSGPHTERRPSPSMRRLDPTSGASPQERQQRYQQDARSQSLPSARRKLERPAADEAASTSTDMGAEGAPKRGSSIRHGTRQQQEPDLLLDSEAVPRQSNGSRLSAQGRNLSTPPSKTAQTKAGVPSRPPASSQLSRVIPPISEAALRASTTHRLQGTIHFKRGDYAMAHSSYSSSMSDVPAAHPLMIVLLTNRALTALKTGEPGQAVADADRALQVIGPGRGVGEAVVVQDETGRGEMRDMAGLYGKALSRKAEALEQMEKWQEAGDVWQQCIETSVGGPAAAKGRRRCRDALSPKTTQAKPRRTVAARPTATTTTTTTKTTKRSSEAVARLREANQAAVREEDEKFALSESVEARVAAWREGKRDNLRALLGSLDKVLWEESGWKAVGMHELVMANKVKMIYMKAIAKTHPDKLPADATTEARLIASLVFSTLNESWDKFRTENGL